MATIAGALKIISLSSSVNLEISVGVSTHLMLSCKDRLNTNEMYNLRLNSYTDL